MNKLTTKKQYKNAFRGNRFYCQRFMIVVCKNNQPYARLGLAIAKKHYKSAVNRNLIKRIIREAFQKSTLPAVDIVFVSLSAANTQNHQQIHQNILKLLNTTKQEIK